jgi:hypothetical protein
MECAIYLGIDYNGSKPNNIKKKILCKERFIKLTAESLGHFCRDSSGTGSTTNRNNSDHIYMKQAGETMTQKQMEKMVNLVELDSNFFSHLIQPTAFSSDGCLYITDAFHQHLANDLIMSMKTANNTEYIR